MGASLCQLHVPSAFDGRAGFDMEASHVFPQGVLTAVTLVQGGTRDRGARVGARYEARLPLCSVAIITLQGQGLIPGCCSRSPEFHAQAGSVSFKRVYFPSPHTGTFATEEGSTEASGAHMGPWLMSAAGRSLMHCLYRCWQLRSDAASGASSLCSSQPTTAPSLRCPGPVVGLQVGPTWTLSPV